MSGGKLRVFFMLLLRPLKREPVRTVLTLLAVSLGISVVIAIELAGQASAGSFHSSMQSLAGDADLEVVATGGLPEQYLATLSKLPFELRLTPRIEDTATVMPSGDTVPVIGLDLIGLADQTSSPKELPQAINKEDFRAINDPQAIWISESVGKEKGDASRLLINDQQRDYLVQGVIPKSDTHGTSDAVIVMDIGAAQQATGKSGRLDRVLIKVPAGHGLGWWREQISKSLPQGAQVRPYGAQTEADRRMLEAFRWNLRILSYVALVVGAFLIYNAISLSVVRRRHDIGVVRALGASRRDVLAAFLCEGALFGLLGSLLGIPLGRLMAQGSVRLLGATVNALYVSSSPGELHFTPLQLLAAIALGTGVAVASALSPAREAASVSPIDALARGKREAAVRQNRRAIVYAALGAAVLASVLAVLPPIAGKPICGYLAALTLILASALAVPSLVEAVLRLSSAILQRVFGVELWMASRSLVGSLRRTAILVGALSTAIAMMVSVGIMVGSFRQTVVAWLDSQLPADLYLRPAGDPASDRHPTLSQNISDRVARVPGVEALDRFRAYEIEYDGLPATIAGADTSVTHFYKTSGFLSGKSANQVIRLLTTGDNAVVSEPFAYKHKVRAGQNITVPLGEQRVRLHVLDIYRDFSAEKGVIIVDRKTLLKYVPDPAASNLAVYLAPGADLQETKSEIQRAVAGEGVLMFTNRDIRTEAVRIFDQTFAITYALEIIAIVVAVIGVAGALFAIVVDRRRELAVMRFLGASRRQISSMILLESGLLGLFSNGVGFVLGTLLSLILVFVINKQSFGWTIEFHWPIAVLLSALSGIYVATVLAGIYPARIAAALPAVEAVHEE